MVASYPEIWSRGGTWPWWAGGPHSYDENMAWGNVSGDWLWGSVKETWSSRLSSKNEESPEASDWERQVSVKEDNRKKVALRCFYRCYINFQFK